MTLPLIHFFAAAFMTGLIWFVQVVHYPLMGSVGEGHFVAYARRHQALTTLVVAPMMLIEALTASLLLWQSWQHRPGLSLELTGMILLIAVWLSTFLVQVPLHARLAKGLSPRTHSLLVGSNWVRTALWSARTVVAAGIVTAR